MDYRFIELTHIDPGLSRQIMAIEQEAFGPGGLNEWFLPPFIRYGRVFVLLDQETVVAAAEYMRSFADPQHAYLFGLAVKKAYRGRGLGKLLLTRSLKSLQRGGFRTVSLTVDPQNTAAVNLYISLGFRQAGFCKDEYGPQQDRLLLVLNLPVEEAHNGA